MSLILYINDKLIELEEKDKFARTLQVNDIGRLNDRQSNLNARLKAKMTPSNRRALDNLASVGSNSNIPYQRNVARLYDDSGECLIPMGWATINNYNEQYYDIMIVDGVVDFYKAIENRTLTEVGLTELNHLKNLENVIETWTDLSIPYRYIHADYNGKIYYDDNKINVDYYVPSANVPYLWNKIFDFIGFTYSGNVFNHEKFKNLWLTYPKPVGSIDQEVNNVFNQTFELQSTNTVIGDGGFGYQTFYLSNLLQEEYSGPIAYTVNSGTGIKVNAPGLYQFHLQGQLSFPINPSARYGIALARVRTGEPIVYEPIITNITAATEIDLVYNFNLEPDQTAYLYLMNGNNPLFFVALNPSNLLIEFNQVLGDNVDFANALIDLGIKDFVNEILWRFGLTPFIEPNSNHIKFLTYQEWLQTQDVLDWSNKNPRRINTQTTFGSYAQRNYLRYKYNEENANYNDGYIPIANSTLKDETTIISSKIYSPEAQKTLFVRYVNVYKIWNKEVKDNAEVTYKALDKRFYFLRSETLNIPSTSIGSETYGVDTTVTQIQIESFWRLTFNEIINDWYLPIGSIFNTSKLIQEELFLSIQDFINFRFTKLIYLEQYQSFYLVNKIMNFVKGKPTRCELIELDYFKVIDDAPEINNGTFITITDISVDGCSLTITFDTDAEFPFPIRVVGTRNTFGGIPNPVLDSFEQIITIEEGNSINITVLQGGFWNFRLFLNNFGDLIYSNAVDIENFAVCVYDTPTTNFLTITNVETVSIDTQANLRTIKVSFDTDFTFPMNIKLSYGFVGIIPGGPTQTFTGVNVNYIIFQVQHQSLFLGVHTVTIMLSSGGLLNDQINSNVVTS